jgi:transposase
MPRISFEKRKYIVLLHQEGKSQRSIAKLLQVSRCGVQEILHKYKKTGSVEDRQKTGRKQKTTARDQRKLVRLSKRNPNFSARQLLNSWIPSSNVSLTTVKRILRKYGLFGRVSAKKPLLLKRHKDKRLMWCKRYLRWSSQDWQKVIFSDECRVELISRRRQYVRRPKGTRFNERYTLKTTRFGGKSLMLWGAIKANGQRSLVRCVGNVNAHEYQRLLTEGLFPIYDNDDIFVQDGASCHTAASTATFMDRHGICAINDWPAQSPDINIIENLWAELKARVSKQHVNTLDELFELCMREWDNISYEKIKHLYLSIPTRLRAITKNKGSNSKY